jgi:hypothetical protein
MKITVIFNSNSAGMDVSPKTTFLSIKEKAIELLNLNAPYIDLYFMGDRPIREFGKQSLMPGQLYRIYDKFKFEDFITTTEREIVFNVVEIYDIVKNENSDQSKKPIYNAKKSDADEKPKVPIDFVIKDEDFPSITTNTTSITTGTNITSTNRTQSNNRTGIMNKVNEPVQNKWSTGKLSF